MSKFNINITLQELTGWAVEDSFNPIKRKQTVEDYLTSLEEIAPVKVALKAKNLVIDEAVDVDDVSFIVEDTKTGINYPYRPALGMIFG